MEPALRAARAGRPALLAAAARLPAPTTASFGFDARNGGPLGNHYASNDYALFRLVEHYVCITGDLAFLDEQAGRATVLEHLERLAYGWKARQTAATGGVLADFGADPWTLLECVPNYVNAVASFNAAYVGMTRSLAACCGSSGRTTAAARRATPRRTRWPGRSSGWRCRAGAGRSATRARRDHRALP